VLGRSTHMPSLVHSCLECTADVFDTTSSNADDCVRQVVHWVLGRSTHMPSLVHSCLECAADVFELEHVTALLTATQLGSITSTLARLVLSATGSNLTLPRQAGKYTSF
jgi:hypothetical protein